MEKTSKIVSRDVAAAKSLQLKAAGKLVGYTSGVFDLLHPGHVRYLEDARAQCDFLIVGLNSDLSVRHLKGPTRPICTESDRAVVVAGLTSVDLIFVFGEQNNNLNITQLSPAIYFKAGDYDKTKLSSAPLIESQGGRVELIPFLAERSSSSIIERIAHLADPAFAPEQLMPVPQPQAAVFLDRDGTINVLKDYMSEPDQFELIPGVIEGLRALQGAGFRLVVTTNQPGIGLGYFTREALYRVNSRFLGMMKSEKILIDKIYFCPHSEAELCGCRKPQPGMIDRACSEMNINRSESFVVGDMTSDIEFAKRAGCRSVLLGTGQAGLDKRYQVVPGFTAPSLREAADWIVSQKEA